jgi:hypothetical protein
MRDTTAEHGVDGMNNELLVSGIVVGVVGAVVLAVILLAPESVRREHRRARSLAQRARDAGLRGHYTFEQDRSKWGATGGFGTYAPVDAEDRALFAVVGSKIEGEAAFFSREMLWTDERLAWLGLPAFLIGIALAVAAALT